MARVLKKEKDTSEVLMAYGASFLSEENDVWPEDVEKKFLMIHSLSWYLDQFYYIIPVSFYFASAFVFDG